MQQEVNAKSSSGYIFFVLLLLMQLGSGLGAVFLPPVLKIAAIIVFILATLCWFGFYLIHPNQAKVLQMFGRYAGTDRNSGLRWANPFYTKVTISLRVRNFEKRILLDVWI